MNNNEDRTKPQINNSSRRRVPQQRKQPVFKFAVMCVLSAGALGGAVTVGLKYIQNQKEQLAFEKEKKQKLNALLAAEEARESEAWGGVLKAYNGALKDVSQLDSAITVINNFMATHPDSNRVKVAQAYVRRLETISDRQASLVQGKSVANDRKITSVVNALIKEAQVHIDNREYTKAYDVFAQYTGALAEESRAARQKQMDILSELRNKELAERSAEKTAAVNARITSILAEVNKTRSFKPLLKILDIDAAYPEMKAIVNTVKDADKVIKSYYQNAVGKVITLNFNNKTRKAKVLDAAADKLTVIMLMNGKKLTTKVRYTSLALSDRIGALQATNREAAALYGAIIALKENDTKMFSRYCKDTGPFADAFLALSADTASNDKKVTAASKERVASSSVSKARPKNTKSSAKRVKLLFEEDFERGRLTLHNSGNRPEVVKDSDAPSGKYVMKSQLNSSRETKYRTEVSLNKKDVIFKVGKEYWLGMSIKLGEDFKDRTDIKDQGMLMQFHYFDWNFPDIPDAQPLLLRYIGNGEIIVDNEVLRKGFGKEKIKRMATVPADIGKWVDWVFHYKIDDKDGIIQIWRNGKLVVDWTGDNHQVEKHTGAYLKFGLYSSQFRKQVKMPQGASRTVYHDEIRIAGDNGSYEAVAPRDSKNKILSQNNMARR